MQGKNYAFAAGLIPAFDQTKDADGETKTAWLDAGTNPPNGVVVHYALAEEPTEPISLAFLDAAGEEVRSFKSKDPKAEETAAADGTGAGLATAEPAAPTGSLAGGEDAASDEDDEEKDKEPTVPAKPGLNRFVWNLRHADAAKIATKGGDQPDRDGPLAAPGGYQVRLVVGDQTCTEAFAILKDPRVAAAEEDLAAQSALGLEIRDRLGAVNGAIDRIRAVREQTEVWAKRTEETPAAEKIAAAVKALKKELDGIEGELIQTRAKSEQDTLNFPVKLNTKLAGLAGSVGSGDGAPTAQQRDLFADLSARVEAQLAALRTIEESAVPAFNDLIRDAALPAIPPPAVAPPAAAAER